VAFSTSSTSSSASLKLPNWKSGKAQLVLFCGQFGHVCDIETALNYGHSVGQLVFFCGALGPLWGSSNLAQTICGQRGKLLLLRKLREKKEEIRDQMETQTEQQVAASLFCSLGLAPIAVRCVMCAAKEAQECAARCQLMAKNSLDHEPKYASQSAESFQRGEKRR